MLIKNTAPAMCDSVEQQYLVQNPQYGGYLCQFIDKYKKAELFCDFEIKWSQNDACLHHAMPKFSRMLRNSRLEGLLKLEIWEAMLIFCSETLSKTPKATSAFGLTNLFILMIILIRKEEVTYRISSVDCERGFSVHNLRKTQLFL